MAKHAGKGSGKPAPEEAENNQAPKLVRGKTLDNGLSLREELFCQLFSSDKEFFANGVESYAEAFNMDITEYRKYKVAQNGASRLLSKPIILNRINEMLELRGLNDAFVDKQLELLITQNAEFSAKLGGIKEYNKLKARITDKQEMNVTHRFEELTDEQLDAAIKARQDRTA